MKHGPPTRKQGSNDVGNLRIYVYPVFFKSKKTECFSELNPHEYSTFTVNVETKQLLIIT